MDNAELLNAALGYAAAGLKVFPLAVGGKSRSRVTASKRQRQTLNRCAAGGVNTLMPISVLLAVAAGRAA